MEENKKTKNIKLTLYIIGILCLMVGVSYATYNLVLKGNKEHQVNIGSLTLKYEETNNINVTGDTLKTDEEGIASTNSFNFKVSVNNTTSKDVNYIVYLTMDEEYKANAKVGKVYLNNKTKNITYGPSFITDLAKYKYTNSYVLCTNTFTSTTETHEYELKSWISATEARNETDDTHETFLGGAVKFKVSVETVESTNLDTSGANAPVLASNMIPVYYDETSATWKKADLANTSIKEQWYSYESSGDKKGMWANAVTVTSTNRATYLNAEPGTTISMDDINTMWVWIPRFNAVTPSNYNGGTAKAPGAIDVTFVKANETALDAFTFGTKSLSGFWYGKFETSHSTLASSTKINNLECATETCDNANKIIIKPNVQSLRANDVSSFFLAARSMEQTGNSFGFVSSEVDTHMSKNNEWGAVAYLTQSIYGRCINSTTCTEVYVNNSIEYYTGRSGGNVGGSTPINGTYTDQTSTKRYNTYGFYTYDDYLLNYNTNTKGNKVQGKGTGASTTGTIYGIYDMSGGILEYVMGMITDKNGNPIVGTGIYDQMGSGFTGMLSDGTTYKDTGIAFPDNKYYNSYTGDSYIGHALTEINGWYDDYYYYDSENYIWFTRGGSIFFKDYSTGIFWTNVNTDKIYINACAWDEIGTRFVLTNE